MAEDVNSGHPNGSARRNGQPGTVEPAKTQAQTVVGRIKSLQGMPPLPTSYREARQRPRG